MYVLLLIVILLVLFYYYATSTFGYWSKKKVKHDPPIPLFGNNFKCYIGKQSSTEKSRELYKKYPDEKVIGYYKARMPELIVKDPDLIRLVLNSDFTSFSHRGLSKGRYDDPLRYSLFSLDGDQWKLLRQRLTSAFTSAKLKSMFPLIINCANKLHAVGEKIVEGDGVCDVKELMARFTTEFIGSCGFGIEMDTINNEKSEFRELGKKIFDMPLSKIIRFLLWEMFPEIRNFIYVGDPFIEKSVIGLVKQIRENRNNKPIGRNDFMDLFIELGNKGVITGESIDKKNEDGSPVQVQMEMDLNCLASQAFVFFAAGFETSSSSSSFTLHQLAFHPEIQQNIQEQIDEVLLKHNNKLCYDSISEMSLLEMAFKEAMRMFPPLGVLNRLCTKRYKFPGLDLTIDPGVKILLPVHAIHNDERYYDNPKEFRPERFAPEEVENRHKYTYLPFGDGPRACIGTRLGQMQALAGLAALLQKFTVSPAPITKRELQVNHIDNVVQTVSEIPLKLTLRKPKTM